MFKINVRCLSAASLLQATLLLCAIAPTTSATTLDNFGSIAIPGECPSEDNNAKYNLYNDKGYALDFDVILNATTEKEARTECADYIIENGSLSKNSDFSLSCKACPKGSKGTTNQMGVEECTVVNTRVVDAVSPIGQVSGVYQDDQGRWHCFRKGQALFQSYVDVEFDCDACVVDGIPCSEYAALFGETAESGGPDVNICVPDEQIGTTIGDFLFQ